MAWNVPLTWTTGHVATAAELNAQLRDNLNFLYGDTSWTPVVYTNGWSDVGSPYRTVAYRFVGTRVVLRGAMKGTTINTAAFTLASGYRPLGDATFICYANGAGGFLYIGATGIVTPISGSLGQFSLEGVAFDTI